MASSPPRYLQGWPNSPGVMKILLIGFEPWLCGGGSASPCYCAISLVIPKLWKKLQMVGSWISSLTSLLSVFGYLVLSRKRVGVGDHSRIDSSGACSALRHLWMHASVVVLWRDVHCCWSLVCSLLLCIGCGYFFLGMWSNRTCPICQGLGHSWRLGGRFYWGLR